MFLYICIVYIIYRQYILNEINTNYINSNHHAGAPFTKGVLLLCIIFIHRLFTNNVACFN
jgi:hypothetical protein